MKLKKLKKKINNIILIILLIYKLEIWTLAMTKIPSSL